MDNPFDFFDQIYCINLPDSKDRWIGAQHEFKRLGILDRVKQSFAKPPVEGIVIPDFKFPRGQLGINLSSLKVLWDAKCANAKNVFIFEDDVTFLGRIDLLPKIEAGLKELPPDWDMFYLGCKPIRATSKFSENLIKVGQVYGAYAYGINDKTMNKIFDMVIHNATGIPYDGLLADLAEEGNSYCIYPPICRTAAGFSTIGVCHTDYDKDTADHWNWFGPKNET